MMNKLETMKLNKVDKIIRSLEYVDVTVMLHNKIKYLKFYGQLFINNRPRFFRLVIVKGSWIASHVLRKSVDQYNESIRFV